MNGKRLFIDSNILVYAHDADAGHKHRVANEKLKSLWDLPVPPSLSIQVLQESYVNFVRKGIEPDMARAIITNYLQWDVVISDGDLLTHGIDASTRWQISFWDGLIVAAAKRANADVIWSEDLNAGQDYGGVVVVNPLL